MTQAETDLRAATDAWMVENPTAPGGAAVIVYDEIQAQQAKAELAKNPPIPGIQSDSDWVLLKAYLTDKGGATDVDKIIGQIDASIEADAQVQVTSGCYSLYKAYKKNRV
jgi:hypothetical protein